VREDIVRRSILRVPVNDRDGVSTSWRHGADAIALDLGPYPGSASRPDARQLLSESVTVAARGGAEVFVVIDKSVAYADITAAALPGVTGAVVPAVETAAEVEDIAGALAEAEQQNGLPLGTLQLFMLLSTANAVWRIRELITGSPRITSAGLDASGLCRDMGIMPREDFDPFLFAAGRLVIECTAAQVQPVGISHPLSVLPRLLPPAELERLAQRGRNTGFKGAICPDPSWVEPCNRAFTPTTEQIDYYREVRRVFAEGIAHDRAAVPLGQQMLDVPVDERAKKQIALWERCQRRDAEKAAAVASA
jgi:citrate lyase subunit beta/citryl-CoA lyase